MGTIDDAIDHNFPIMISEDKGGMISIFKKRLVERKIDREPLENTPCISVYFDYENAHGMLFEFIDDDTAPPRYSSFKVGYSASRIGRIYGVFYHLNDEATDKAKKVLQGSLAKFNDEYADLVPHGVDLFQTKKAEAQPKPFTKSRAQSALAHLNASIRKQRNQDSARQ